MYLIQTIRFWVSCCWAHQLYHSVF